MKIAILIYLFVAIAVKIIHYLRNRDLKEWVHEEYYGYFKECSTKENSYFLKGKEIPTDKATILIIGRIRTTNKTILLLDFVADLVTFGFLRFNEIIPLGDPTKLRLYFKNISKIQTEIHSAVTDFFIVYPGSDKPSRNWKMKIPELLKVGDSCFIESSRFFSPEVPGTHALLIAGLKDIVLAGPFGVSDRKYRIPLSGAPWNLIFHVSSGYEYRTFIVAFFALAVAIISIIISIMN